VTVVASSLGSRRFLLAAICAVGVLACGGLANRASAAPVEAPQPGSASSAEPAGVALRIGALSERLFDAAAASQWPSVQSTLQTLHELARQLDGPFEDPFLAAGGSIEDLDSARNALAGDLADADIDAIAMEPHALGRVANRVTLIAGELAQPFAEAPGAPLALKIDAAMFQARCLRDALVWGDQFGYESARQKFHRLWLGLRDSPGLDPAKVAALDRALTKAASSRDEETVRELQSAAQDALGGLGTSLRPAP
jgi:hypothetical protein